MALPSRKLSALHSPVQADDPTKSHPGMRKQVAPVSPFGFIPRHRRVTAGSCGWRPAWGSLHSSGVHVAARAQSPAASVDVVREQMRPLGHDQPVWMPCFLADERSTPWAGLARLQLALPLNPSLERAAKGRSQLPALVHTGRPGPSQPWPAPAPPAASRHLPTPDPRSFLTSAGWPL